MKKSLYIAVIGCGRLGAILASDLSKQGHKVVVIDVHNSTFNHLSKEFSGFSIAGNTAEMSVLESAKLDQAEIANAVTGKDNLNIMVSKLAKNVFEFPIVLTRILDPAREEIYQKLGLTTISTTKISAVAFLDALQQKLSVLNVSG
ncbi:MAG: NAD-binding protein [Xenococcus sp. (in: cyanobacteria)]